MVAQVCASHGCRGADDADETTRRRVTSVFFPCQAQSPKRKESDFDCDLNSGIWNLVVTALSLSKRNERKLEVKYEDNT